MTPRMPRVTGVDVVYALRQLGFEIDYVKGSHYHLRHRDNPKRKTIVPIHRGQIIKPWQLSRAYPPKGGFLPALEDALQVRGFALQYTKSKPFVSWR